ncbi:LysR family transcriptional regulator [Bordetella genomosp. 8]|uniref:LysR family transcriptional regulator n=1 Tax=Bordetella genomosp. 8 TaxID=1416806 RepID=A0A1W6YLH7_9BORD|nr:LysR family transcriptional regulator [Bordetella genomosp. 8]ARP81834.1 LysR family transcriptional regulator [Bordetella genomosp. 8]
MTERADAAIPEITAFAAVAQTGSFTKAAENLGTSKSNVGKAVQRLERRLGTRLFQRTTRAVRLTEDGETYLQAAQTALDSLRDAELALAARRDEPIGRVRIDLPAGFGRLLLPSFAELRKRYPRITLEAALTDRMSDAVGEGWDIVVRIGILPADSDMTVRKLCDLRLGLYAAPEYLARHAPIRSVSELSVHDAVIFRGPNGRLRPWTVQDGGIVREISPSPVMVLADGQALVEATIHGMGVSQILDRVARPHVDAGRLVHLLPASDVDGPPVHALIPLGRRMPSKARVVLDHLAEQLRPA